MSKGKIHAWLVAACAANCSQNPPLSLCSPGLSSASAQRPQESSPLPQPVRTLPLPMPPLTRLAEQRRAAVALIIRVVPSPHSPTPQTPDKPYSLSEFFDAAWVNDPRARPEILFLHRDDAAQPSDASLWQAKLRHNTSEAHVAFPGGRTEPDDEGGLYTGLSVLCLPNTLA